VRQIAQNLLSNALKFTEEGVIRFTVKRLNTTHVCLEVTDTGPGVPLEVQTQIFEPFAQADSSTTRRYGGTGLGLAIVREICELMDGHCDVSSETGRGSRFWCVVSLPSTTAHPPQAPVAQKAPEVLPLQDRKVMVAEDNPVNRMIITLMLEQQGAKVVTVNDGRQLLKVLDERLTGGMLPDAILMDMQMPGMDGKEATRAVRQHTGLRHIPIIALTAGVTSEEREDALTSGVDDYLVKPIDPELLCRALQRRMRDT
jgi:CheY-like chemotaxis protein